MTDLFQPPPAFFEFRIVRPLGKGAMGEVFLADDELLGRQVAIKFVREGDRPEVRSRFLLEARALARLSHPNVVTVHRVGEILGRPFIVSEWVKGRSLDQWPLPLEPPLVLRVALQLARALAAVHRAGVLHRDLKPGNVLLSEALEVKLVDFGASTALTALDALPPRRDDLAQTQPLPGALDSAPPLAAVLQVGTPLYAAPELLGGEPATRLSDLYAWGALVYEIAAGRPPYQAATVPELHAKVRAGGFAPLIRAQRELTELVHACLSPDPGARPQRAEALLANLEPMLAQQAGPLPDEPYRGLSVFGPEHARLFFGREREIRAVLEKLSDATFVLVAGDSGVGKSSLCRAGVVPQLQAGALGQRKLEVVALSLGARPVDALAAGLRGWLDLGERDAAAALRSAPEQLASLVRREGRALFLDGLEDLVSVAPGDDLDAMGRFAGALTVRSPGFRLLATARSDSLTRLAAVPSLGSGVTDALYLLRPLSDEGLRQAIEGPARAAHFRFEPESVVDELVAAARVGPGALPLVQFALAELWRRRDREARVIRRDELVAMGGVGAALAHHADEAVAQLPAVQRNAAEEILRRLVTAQGTRARRTRADLVPPGARNAELALQALVDSRILISSDSSQDAVYELAHEALIQSWDQLRAWVGHDEQRRALTQRIERAADEWERTGEGLWSRKLLRDLRAFPGLVLGGREQRFLAASRRAALRKWLLLASAAILLALVVLEVRARAQAESRGMALQRLREGTAALEAARSADADEAALRKESFALFDAGDSAQAEPKWAKVRSLAAAIERDLEQARADADSALLLWPGDDARKLLSDLLVFRLSRTHDDPLSRDRPGLLAQLAPIDPGGALRGRFERPARLHVDVRASLRAGDAAIPLEPGSERDVAPGSYVLELPGDVRLPLLLRFGDRQDLRLRGTPPAPSGFISVPAGKFLYGFDGDEDVRLGFFGAAPLHERDSGAFAIGRTEVTFAEWLSYLRALPPAERTRRTPEAAQIQLTAQRDGRYVLHIQPTTRMYQAVEGSPIVFPGRKRNVTVDWRKFPATGISFEDARAYARWLAATGIVRGARLCREEEWERAARGADGRSFPGGDALSGDDANIDETYGREPLAFGPDPAGSHPRSTSPIGAADMAGNAWEMTVSSAGTPVIRGGSWYHGALTARSVNREPYEATARGLLVGFRLCVSPP